jgi:hypothetical protein
MTQIERPPRVEPGRARAGGGRGTGKAAGRPEDMACGQPARKGDVTEALCIYVCLGGRVVRGLGVGVWVG